MLKKVKRQTKKQKQKFEYSNQDAIKKMKFKWKDKENIATKKNTFLIYIFLTTSTNLHLKSYQNLSNKKLKT